MEHVSFSLTREERKDQVKRIRTSKTPERCQIAQSEVLCPRAQVILSEDPHARVQRALCTNPNLLRTIQVKLASSTARATKRSLAEYQPNLHPEAQALLVADGERWLLDCLAENPGTLEMTTLTALAMSGRQVTSWTVLRRPEATEEWIDSLIDFYQTGTHQRKNYSVKEYLLPLIIGPGKDVERQTKAVISRNADLIAAVLGEGTWPPDHRTPSVPEHILQANAPVRVVPEWLLKTWAGKHPRGDEVLDLAPTWRGTYQELIEAVDLVGRST